MFGAFLFDFLFFFAFALFYSGSSLFIFFFSLVVAVFILRYFITLAFFFACCYVLCVSFLSLHSIFVTLLNILLYLLVWFFLCLLPFPLTPLQFHPISSIQPFLGYPACIPLLCFFLLLFLKPVYPICSCCGCC